MAAVSPFAVIAGLVVMVALQAALAAWLLVQRWKRLRAEAALRRSEAKATALLRMVPDLMFVMSRDGVYLDYHARTPSELFAPPEAFLGKRMRDIFPAEMADMFEHHFQRTLDADEPIVIEYSLPMPGGERHYETRLVRCDHDTVMTIVRDVTSVRQAEDDLHRAQAELARAARAGLLGELTAGIAHEVSQPLAAMITNARACLRQLDAGPDRALLVRDALEDIVSEGKRASDVITRVRGLARQAPLKRTPVSLNDVVQDVLGLCNRTLRRRGVTLRVELEPDLPPILGDRVQLQQLLLNLILNGTEAMAGVTGRSRVLTIRSGRAGDDRVALAVSDSGAGLEGLDAAAVFAPFSPVTSDSIGVDLSISRSIAEAHGGRIRVTRDTPEGATFEVELPGA